MEVQIRSIAVKYCIAKALKRQVLYGVLIENTKKQGNFENAEYHMGVSKTLKCCMVIVKITKC